MKNRIGMQNVAQDGLRSVAVIGAGAIGSLYGAMLQKAGCLVEYYTRSGAEKLAKRKMRIRSVWGNFSLQVNAYADTSQMHKADLVLVTNKVYPEIDYKALLGPVVGPQTVIMTLQNGIDTTEAIAKIFKKNRVIGGLAFTCINRNAPHKIAHLDFGLVRVGYIKKEDVAVAKQVTSLFEAAGIEVAYNGALRPIQWKKLLWNVPFNTLSVICGAVTTDKIMASAPIVELALALMEEVRAIAKADGCTIGKAELDKMIENTRRMQPYKTSMLLDYEHGRPMEVEAILGEPLRIAKKLKVAAPHIETLYALLKFEA